MKLFNCFSMVFLVIIYTTGYKKKRICFVKYLFTTVKGEVSTVKIPLSLSGIIILSRVLSSSPARPEVGEGGGNILVCVV